MALSALLVKNTKTYVVKIFDSDGYLIFTCTTGKTKQLALENLGKVQVASQDSNNWGQISSKTGVYRNIISNTGKRVGSTRGEKTASITDDYKTQINSGIMTVTALNF